MTLLLYEPFDGYELNSSYFLTKYGNVGYQLTRNASGVTGRPSGSIFALRNASLSGEGQFVFTGGTHPETIVYLALYIRANSPDIVFGSSVNSATFYIRISATTITINNNIREVFSIPNTSVPYNTWNFLQIRSVISSGSFGSGSVELKNDGKLIFSASNINTNGSNRTPALGMFYVNLPNFRENSVLIDDILILETTGSSFNQPIGSGNFFMASYIPSSSGVYTDMTSSGASTDANAINERPPNNDTSYLIATSSGPFPLRETFTLRPANTGSTFTTIPISASIEAILKRSVARASIIGVSGFDHLLRVNGADYTGSVPISASTTYTDFINGWERNPNTGNKFLPSEFSSLETGFIRNS